MQIDEEATEKINVVLHKLRKHEEAGDVRFPGVSREPLYNRREKICICIICVLVATFFLVLGWALIGS